MDLGLTGKRVLVTGGSTGIGAGIASAMAREGAKVAINYVVHPETAKATEDELKKLGVETMTVQADVSDPGAVDAMFAAIDRRWQGLDVLVNNAGVDGPHALAWESDVDAWMRVIDINLKGAYLCARAALKRMVPAKSGVILNISSVHEVIAWAGYSAYAASKAGVSILSKTLAQEAAGAGVRVLCIAPGAIKTKINQAVWSNPDSYADLIEKIPLGRIGTPAEIGAVAAMLASPAASYVTATTIFVDGGMTDYPSFVHGG